MVYWVTDFLCPIPVAPTWGKSPDLERPYRPMNSSTLKAAVLRSMFSLRAVEINSFKTGSSNCPHQAVLAASLASFSSKRQDEGMSIVGRR